MKYELLLVSKSRVAAIFDEKGPWSVLNGTMCEMYGVTGPGSICFIGKLMVISLLSVLM